MLKYGFKVRALSVAILTVGSFLRAYVLAQCWLWFAVPLGAPLIGKAHVYGLAMLTLFATYTWPTTDKEVIDAAGDKRKATRGEVSSYLGFIIAKTWLVSLVTLGFAYVARYFMTF